MFTARAIDRRVHSIDNDPLSSDDDDDLDFVPVPLNRKLAHNAPLDKAVIPNRQVRFDQHSAPDTERPYSARNKAAPAVETVNERVTWTDDEDDLPRPKKTATKPVKKPSTRQKKNVPSIPSIVGRRAPKPTSKKTYTVSKMYASESEDSNEHTSVPSYVKQRRGRFDQYRERLGEAGLRLPPSYEDVYFSDDERLGDLAEKPVFLSEPAAAYEDVELRYSAGIIPAPIAQRLRDYQVLGAEFLHELFVFQRGGILGDDMGLGKTIQVIAFLTAAFGKTADERDAKRMRKVRRMGDQRWYPKVLIICPGTLMDNWISELRCWGWWHVDKFHGSAAARDEVLSAARNGRTEIIITTYDTYKGHQGAINLIEWDCVIADECHSIKEPKAEKTKAINKVNALCRIGLTGTAIQNKYDELWTLLNWTNPGAFGPLRAWRDSISTPLKMGQAHDATNAELSLARKTAKKLVENLLPKFFRRRMKSLIADQLPKKSDRVVFCPLTDTQAEAYELLVGSDLIQYIRRSSELCDCDSGRKRGYCCYREIPGRGKWQILVFPMLQCLQKLSNHLCMLVPHGTDEDKKERDLECLQIAVPDRWKDLYRDRDNILNYANQDFCGKWKVLKKLLSFWYDNGDKVLVFSYSVHLLKMLQMLFKATTAYNVAYLDGSMNYGDRTLAVDDFNTNPTQFVFLISIKAGGVGLNITSANKVVVFDPNWNPSYDLQAQDRAYRIGQTRDVEVFRLISAGTVEEIVYARQIYKQQQANIAYNASSERRYFSGVQDFKDKKGEIFGLQNIFAFQGDNVVLREIVNKTNVAESKAGVNVLDIDMDDAADDIKSDDADGFGSEDAKETAAMSQLAALITGEPAPGSKGPKRKKEPRGAEAEAEADDDENDAAATKRRKTDAVAAILAGAGVEYTHENSEVVGSSRVETRLSERAQQGHLDLEYLDQHAFRKSQEYGRDGGDDDGDGGGAGSGEGAMLGRDGGGYRSGYRYRPPEHIRRRQFVSMAEYARYGDVTDFALVVEGWTQERRRDFLDGFYLERRKVLQAMT